MPDSAGPHRFRLIADDLVAVDLNGHACCQDGDGGESEEAVLFEALVFGLREYCRQTGFDRVLLGMSGGIDSSLCAVIAGQAMGPENVLGLSMPSSHSSVETRASAEIVCRNAGIPFMEMPIADLHERVAVFFESHRRIRRGVTDENIQARLRGLLLMAMANDTGRMVIATGNKTELGLGYCTLYGDMVGGLLLIGDLNKTQVYRLADYINHLVERDMIPREVMARQPSAELAVDQSDPFDYTVVAPMVDDLIARDGPRRIMNRFREGRLGSDYPANIGETCTEKRFRDTLQDVHRRYQAAAFKRAQASPTVIVSHRALGFDLRETIINKWSPEWN